MIKKLLGAMLLSSALTYPTLAQQPDNKENEQPPLQLSALNHLIGEWSVETTYANGAVGSGDRTCGLDLGDAYIRCETTIVFAHNDRPRRSVDYINANPGRNLFESVTMWEFPASKKLVDMTAPTDDGEIYSRGFLYTGDGAFSRRISETWVIGKDEVTITLRMNRLDQKAEEFPVFLEHKMTRKR